MDFKHDILPLKNIIFRTALRIILNREEAEKLDSYIAEFTSASAKKMKYQAGDSIIIEIKPTGEDSVGTLTFRYRAVAIKKALVLTSIAFERVK